MAPAGGRGSKEIPGGGARVKSAIVVTTIFEPAFLSGYLENLDSHGRRDDVAIVVIPDRKTPATVFEACALAVDSGFGVRCPTLVEQEMFLKRFPGLAGRIPYDSDNRRNIGFLMALDDGAETLVSIDDDNYCIPESDFAGDHSFVGREASFESVESDDGWFNLCSLLETSVMDDIYPRGFPYFARRRLRKVTSGAVERRKVALNVGLWLTDPDVDAVTRLALSPHVFGATAGSRFLGHSTWSPINTQNTALTREAASAYYYVRMGFPVGGMKIDRYGDILSGYFLQKCVKVRGEGILVGAPVADHRRTPHNLFKDLSQEVAGMVILEDLLPWLQAVEIGAGPYGEMYLALAEQLEEQSHRFSGFLWNEGAGEFLRETAANMKAWVEAVATIG